MDDLTKLKQNVEPYVLDGHVDDLARYADAREGCYACGLIEFVEQFRYAYESLAHDWHLAQRVAANHRCNYELRLEVARNRIRAEQAVLELDRLDRKERQLRQDNAAAAAAAGWMPRQVDGPLRTELSSDKPAYAQAVAEQFPLIALRFNREGFGWPTIDQATATFVTLTGYDESVAYRVLVAELDREGTPLTDYMDDLGSFRLRVAESAHADLEPALDEWRTIDGGQRLPAAQIAGRIPR